MAETKQQNKPLVSVIIPTYNCAKYLPDAIESALAQDYKPIEIIVGDDGSTDDTSRVLDQYTHQVRVVRHKKNANKGLGATRNLMIRDARGELIAPLDADDMWLPDKVTRQANVLLENMSTAVCHTATEMFGTARGDGPMTENVRRRIHGRCFNELFRRNGVAVSSTMIRRSMMPAHLFYEDLYGTEDYALWMQMLLEHEAFYLPSVVTRIRRHRSQMTADDGKRIQVFSGLARLRALEHHANRLDHDQLHELRKWALDELETCAYSRYWQRDFPTASIGFKELRYYGKAVNVKHRLSAKIFSLFSRPLT